MTEVVRKFLRASLSLARGSWNTPRPRQILRSRIRQRKRSGFVGSASAQENGSLVFWFIGFLVHPFVVSLFKWICPLERKAKQRILELVSCLL